MGFSVLFAREIHNPERVQYNDIRGRRKALRRISFSVYETYKLNALIGYSNIY